MGCLSRVDPFGSQSSLASETLDVRSTVCDSDPVTEVGRKTMMTMMMTVPLLTLVLLAIQAAVYLSTSVIVMMDLEDAAGDIEDLWRINDLMESLQLERDTLVEYSYNTTDVTTDELESSFERTDTALSRTSGWPSGMYSDEIWVPSPAWLRQELPTTRHHFLNSTNDTLSILIDISPFYHDVIMGLANGISAFTHSLEANKEGLLDYMIAYYSVEMAIEYSYLERFLGEYAVDPSGVMRSDLLNEFVIATYVGYACLNETLRHSVTATDIHTSYEIDPRNSYGVLKKLESSIMLDGHVGIQGYPEVLANWSAVITTHIEVLNDIKRAIESEESASVYAKKADSSNRMAGLGVFAAVIICGAPTLLWWVRKITLRVHRYATSLNDTNMKLRREKKKGDVLLYQLLPKSVALQLKMNKKVSAETYKAVTIFFSDICGFTAISSRSTPMEVVAFLNKLYNLFDGVIEKYDVYKVETIGDAYMVASGCPLRNGNRHVGEIASMSLSLMDGMRRFKAPHLPEEDIRMRVGLHTGGVVSGVVGMKMPRYCLFGDTVTIASAMESGGVPMQIQISEATRACLDTLGGYVHELRGQISFKIGSRGIDMTTHFLTGRISSHTDSRATGKLTGGSF